MEFCTISALVILILSEERPNYFQISIYTGFDIMLAREYFDEIGILRALHFSIKLFNSIYL
jgi:hypothetical protein